METFSCSELPGTSGKRSLVYLEARLPPLAAASGARSINSGPTVEKRARALNRRHSCNRRWAGGGGGRFIPTLRGWSTHNPESPLGTGDKRTDSAIARYQKYGAILNILWRSLHVSPRMTQAMRWPPVDFPRILPGPPLCSSAPHMRVALSSRS